MLQLHLSHVQITTGCLQYLHSEKSQKKNILRGESKFGILRFSPLITTATKTEPEFNKSCVGDAPPLQLLISHLQELGYANIGHAQQNSVKKFTNRWNYFNTAEQCTLFSIPLPIKRCWFLPFSKGYTIRVHTMLRCQFLSFTCLPAGSIAGNTVTKMVGGEYEVVLSFGRVKGALRHHRAIANHARNTK